MCVIRGLGGKSAERFWQYFLCSPYFKGSLSADEPGRLQSWSVYWWRQLCITRAVMVSASDGFQHPDTDSREAESPGPGWDAPAGTPALLRRNKEAVRRLEGRASRADSGRTPRHPGAGLNPDGALPPVSSICGHKSPHSFYH